MIRNLGVIKCFCFVLIITVEVRKLSQNISLVEDVASLQKWIFIDQVEMGPGPPVQLVLIQLIWNARIKMTKHSP